MDEFGWTMNRLVLRDDQWERIEHLLPGKASDCGVTAKDNRLFVEAVLWIARTGAPWRDLPESFERWHTVYMRYSQGASAWSVKKTRKTSKPWANLEAD